MLIKVRKASNEPMSTVVETVEINTIEDLIALEKKYNNSLIISLDFNLELLFINSSINPSA